eukprot:1159612-Pelagomonas_calceolata.AAC.2
MRAVWGPPKASRACAMDVRLLERVRQAAASRGRWDLCQQKQGMCVHAGVRVRKCMHVIARYCTRAQMHACRTRQIAYEIT